MGPAIARHRRQGSVGVSAGVADWQLKLAASPAAAMPAPAAYRRSASGASAASEASGADAPTATASASGVSDFAADASRTRLRPPPPSPFIVGRIRAPGDDSDDDGSRAGRTYSGYGSSGSSGSSSASPRARPVRAPLAAAGSRTFDARVLQAPETWRAISTLLSGGRAMSAPDLMGGGGGGGTSGSGSGRGGGGRRSFEAPERRERALSVSPSMLRRAGDWRGPPGPAAPKAVAPTAGAARHPLRPPPPPPPAPAPRSSAPLRQRPGS